MTSRRNASITVHERILATLDEADHGARFVSEVVRKGDMAKPEVEEALATLEGEGKLLVRAYYCADHPGGGRSAHRRRGEASERRRPRRSRPAFRHSTQPGKTRSPPTWPTTAAAKTARDEFRGNGLRIGADIGGTFTDVVVFDEAAQTIRLGKALSTPAELARGIEDALIKTDAPLPEADLLIHGSTIVINAVIERKGAETALSRRRASATSTRSAASTGRSRSTCSSASTARSYRAS